ncbi:MAG TPA: DHA2 family efflux MFS transporter permease subunit [Nevskiaceae bacterium]|nr:DHA2 family efflux MFS transporter permease subunit [Nevskiaceae bacterium]
MAVQSQAQPLHPWLPPRQLALLTVALGLGVFMNVLDSSIANVSIPTISGDLAVSADNGTFIITSFAVANAVSVPISGWLAKRFGEVRLFVVCTLLFTLFSLTCGLAPTFPILLVSRVLQGAAAGPMIPISLSLLLNNYPLHRQGFANGIWGMTAIVGPVAGPVLGGIITDNYRWNWIFYINVPFGIICAAITWMLLKDRETKILHSKVDFIGLILLTVGLFSLQVMLDKGNDDAWFQSNFIVILGLIAAFTLLIFFVWEATDKNPLVELRLFKIRNFSVASIAMVLGYMCYFGGVVVLPLWLQTALPYNYNPTWAGYATASIGILGVVTAPLAGRMADKYDVRVMVSFGMLIFAAVSFAVAFSNSDINFGRIFLYRLPWGIGMPFFFVPLQMLAFRGIAPQDMAAAASLFNFVRLEGLSVGTSLSVALWDGREAIHDHHITEFVNDVNPAIHGFLQHAEHLGLTTQQALAMLRHSIQDQAFMISLNDVYWLSGWIFIALTTLVWFSRPVRVHKPD